MAYTASIESDITINVIDTRVKWGGLSLLDGWMDTLLIEICGQNMNLHGKFGFKRISSAYVEGNARIRFSKESITKTKFRNYKKMKKAYDPSGNTELIYTSVENISTAPTVNKNITPPEKDIIAKGTKVDLNMLRYYAETDDPPTEEHFAFQI